jgi:hypothetical protein
MLMMSTDIKLFSYCVEGSVADPHHFGKSYPDPHLSQNKDSVPDPNQSPNSGAPEAQNGAMDARRRRGSSRRRESSHWSHRGPEGQ